MTVQYKTRTQLVTEALREKILNGSIKGGAPLRQSALAEELQVSRIPVREALLQLEAEGLVKFEAHKGAVATHLSSSECRELFALRAIIETDVLKDAILQHTQADWNKAEETLNELDLLLDSGSSIEHWSELNFKFHDALYQPANRALTLDMIRSLNINSDRYIRLQLLLTDWIPQAENEHRQILELCKIKDTENACALLKSHIEEAGRSVAELLEKQSN